MASYDIKTITLPNGDICNLRDSTVPAIDAQTIALYGALGWTPPSDTDPDSLDVDTTTVDIYEDLGWSE